MYPTAAPAPDINARILSPRPREDDFSHCISNERFLECGCGAIYAEQHCEIHQTSIFRHPRNRRNHFEGFIVSDDMKANPQAEKNRRNQPKHRGKQPITIGYTAYRG
jgi:hypothetical protein